MTSTRRPSSPLLSRITRAVVGLALAALLAPAASRAGDWVSTGGAPEGGTVTEVAVHAGRAWAATPIGGLFHSNDGGRSWERVEEAPVLRASGFLIDPDWPRGPILALAIDPVDPDTAYVSIPAAVLKTADGGRTWRPTGLAGDITSIAIAPSDRQVLYLADTRRAWRSDNGGATWRPARPLPDLADLSSLAVDPHDPLTVYAATDSGVVRSANGGRTWTAGPRLDSFGEIRRVAVDPGDSNLVYAASRFGDIWRSTDRGANWTQTADLGVDFDITDLEFDPTAPGALLLAGSRFPSSGPVNATSGRLLRSVDRGRTWTPLLATEVINDLDFDPARPGEALLATDALGVWRSTDSAATWTPSNAGLEAALALQLVPDPQTPGTLYAAVDTYRKEPTLPASLGIWKSTDRAATWAPASQGLSGPGAPLPEILDLAADPARPGVLYAATSEGLFKTADGAATWSRADAGSQVAIPLDAALDPHDPDIVYTVGPRSDRRSFAVARSENGGATWVRRFGVPATTAIQSVVVDLWSPATAFVSSAAGFYRSQDDGVTWTRVSPPQNPFNRLVSGLAPGQLAGLGGTGFDLLVSPDEGATWSPVNLPGGSRFENTVYDLSRSSLTEREAALYAASRFGVAVLVPGTTAWAPVGGRFWAFSAAADPAAPGRVYAGARDGRILVFEN